MKKMFLFQIAVFGSALLISLPISGCSESDSDDLNEGGDEQDDDDDADERTPCEEQNECLKSGVQHFNNCGANNQCYICKQGFCETLWEGSTPPKSEDTAMDMFNLSWNGDLITVGCQFDISFYSKVRSDGSSLTCADIMSGDTAKANLMLETSAQKWGGKCERNTPPVTTQLSLIPAEIEFLWLTRMYEGNRVDEAGTLIGMNCKELNGIEIDSTGGYPKGFVRDSSSLYKPSMKIEPLK